MKVLRLIVLATAVVATSVLFTTGGGLADPGVCGNEVVESPEECDPPASPSAQCEQVDACVGPLWYDWPSDLVDCQANCMCAWETAAGQCNIAQCGAQCETSADCYGAMVCNLVTCVCENAPGVRSRVDTDADGFSDNHETCMGTDPLDDCADTSTANDEHPDPWPPDFDDDQVCVVTDFLIFVNKFPSAVTEPGDERWDFDCNLVVDITDALMFLAFFPSTCI